MGIREGEGVCAPHAGYIDGLIRFSTIVGHPRHILDCGYGGGISHGVWLETWEDCEVYCISPEEPGKFGWEGGARPLSVIDIDNPRFHFSLGVMENLPIIWPHLSQGFFDMVFIDTEHSYEGQIAQVKVGWAALREGGIMSGHDYNRYEVRRGTIEALGFEPESLRLPDTTEVFFAKK